MSELVERLNNLSQLSSGNTVGGRKTMKEAADEIDRLSERCDAYKGQVKAGSDEIEKLGRQLENAKSILIALDQVLDFAGYEELGHTWCFDDLSLVAETFAKAHALLTDDHSEGGK